MSPILFHDLFQCQTDAMSGPMNLCANPKEAPDDLKKGESVTMTNGTLQLLKWKNKRDVHMYYTAHSRVYRAVNKTTEQAIQRPSLHNGQEQNYMEAKDRCRHADDLLPSIIMLSFFPICS